MNRIVLLSLAALTVGCTAQEPVELTANAQNKLDEELRGRVAGTPVSCVNSRDLRGNRSAGEGVLIFDGPSRNLIYVNRPGAGCPEVGLGRALRTRTPSTRLCAGDIASVFDPVSGFEYGGCGLGEFTPYRRVR